MKSKVSIFLMGMMLISGLLGMSFLPASPPASKVNMDIINIDGVWKVVQNSNHKKFQLKAKKNTTIIWKAVGTDVIFQFPNSLFSPVEQSDSLNGGSTKTLKSGKKLKLKVKANAPKGTYEYAAFCATGGVFAIGGSPPKIIIE